MVAFNLFSALALVLPAVSTLVEAVPTSKRRQEAGIKTSEFTPFNLVTQVTQGNSSFDGLQLVGVHSGAAHLLPVARSSSEYKPGRFSHGGYVLNNTFVDILYDPPMKQIYSLGLENYNAQFSPLYHISGDAQRPTNLNGDAGQQTRGFVIDNGVLCYNGIDLPFQTFTICGGVEIYGPPPGNALFWRNTMSTPNLVECADVKLLVQYPS